MKKRFGMALACLVASGMWLAGSAPARAAGTADVKTPQRQSLDMRVTLPPTPVTIAGSSRLVYELQLTNRSRIPLVLERVEVLAAEDARPLADLDNDALERHLKRLGKSSGEPDPRTIAPGGRSVVYLWLTPDDGMLPKVLEHRITFHFADKTTRQPSTVLGRRVAVQAGPPVALGPPLCSGPWVAVYNPLWQRGHRRTYYAVENGSDGAARIPGRYAVDWIKVNADGELARDDKDKVNHWFGYGAKVLAVADSVVAATRDGLPESATLSDAHPDTDAGNFIALELGQNRYAVYEHLKPGSIRVKPGERVTRGQVIAALGFTGHSTGPHLHFHVADAASPLGAEGRPFVLDSFRLLGAYKDFDKLGTRPWTPRDDATRARHTSELPAPFAVVEFEPCPGDMR